jgi:hypothetical protein
MPSDPGPDLVQDDPPFSALQFTEDEVQSVLLGLDISKGAELKNCESAFVRPLSLFLTGGNFPT